MNGYVLYLIWGFVSDLMFQGGRVFEVGRDINFLLES